MTTLRVLPTPVKKNSALNLAEIERRRPGVVARFDQATQALYELRRLRVLTQALPADEHKLAAYALNAIEAVLVAPLDEWFSATH